ncbi:hypothetical protein PO909_003204, partial [Leuciscus waleckii]
SYCKTRQGLCYAKANSSLITSTPKLRRAIFPTTITNSRRHPHRSHSHPDREKMHGLIHVSLAESFYGAATKSLQHQNKQNHSIKFAWVSPHAFRNDTELE